MRSDHDNLIAAIIANPGDDLPRLVLADWLEEHAGEVECDHSDMGEDELRWYGYEGCPTCKGTCRVSNGFAERAEFIRVQVELAGEVKPCSSAYSQKKCRCSNCTKQEALRQRERELWVAHCKEWFNVGGITAAKLRNDSSQNNYGKVLAVIERGFPAEVRAPLAVLVGGECENCVGRGKHTVFGEDHECQSCLGTGTTPGIAHEISKCQPVTTWVATDKEPVHTNTGRFEQEDWAWVEHPPEDRLGWSEDDRGHFLPRWMWDRLEGHITTPSARTRAKRYPTRELALAALSRAIGEIAKQGEKV